MKSPSFRYSALIAAVLLGIFAFTGAWHARKNERLLDASKLRAPMRGYVTNIEKLSLLNENYREVIYTDKNSQLVLMSLLPGEEIGEEVHDVDQFLRIEAGTGRAVLNGAPYDIASGSAIVVPAGTKHNIINTGSDSMKLYTLYSPPHHRDGVIEKTKTEAEADMTDVFDGKTTE